MFAPALEINSQNSESWNYKGHVFRNSKKYEEAIKAFDKVIEISPNDSLAWDNKGDLLERLAKYNEAMKVYDKAIEINQQGPLIRYKKEKLSKHIK